MLPFALTVCVGEERDRILRIPVPSPIDQRDYADSKNACGPCCLLMQFQNGSPAMRQRYAELVGSDPQTKLRYVVDRLFKNQRSEASPKFKRWGAHGVFPMDLGKAANELLEDPRRPLSEDWLDREDGKEMDHEFVRRVHGSIRDSIAAGVPPILSLRSFVARRKEESPGEREWKPGGHHFVLVTEVPDRIEEGDVGAGIKAARGFRIGLIDPHGGKKTEAFVYIEPNGQPFRVLKGNEHRGVELGGRSFLLVSAPAVLSVRPHEPDWSDRIVVIANYLVGAF